MTLEFGVKVPESGNFRRSKYRKLYKEFLDSAETTARINFNTIEAANSARNVLNQISKKDGGLIKLRRFETYVYFEYTNDTDTDADEGTAS